MRWRPIGGGTVDAEKFLQEEPKEERDLETDFSFSKLYTLTQCAQKAFLRYVLGLPDDTRYLIAGKGVHLGQQTDNEGKVEGKDLTVKQVLDAAVEGVREEATKRSVAVDLDSFAKDHQTQLQRLRDRGWRDQIVPVKGTIEAPFTIGLKIQDEKDAKILGFVDVVSQREENDKRRVVDYKSGARPVYQGDAQSSLQFALYQLGAKAPESQVISFVRSGRQKATVHRTAPVELSQVRVNKLLGWLEDAIKLWRSCLKSGFWPRCSPNAHYCSDHACAYYGRCYPKEGRPVQFISLGEIKPVGTLPIPEWRK